MSDKEKDIVIYTLDNEHNFQHAIELLSMEHVKFRADHTMLMITLKDFPSDILGVPMCGMSHETQQFLHEHCYMMTFTGKGKLFKRGRR